MKKWEIKTEPAGEPSFVYGGTNVMGESLDQVGDTTRIKFRKIGSRGRFESFVVVGDMVSDLQQLVDRYLEKKP